ncbi:MAG: ABC transporter permease [Bacteroidota bacterium]
MLKSYLIIFFRNIIKHNAFTFINILGLAIGLATSIALGLYVADELSYDRHFTEAENIFRMRHAFFIGEKEYDWPETSAQLAGVLEESFPEVVSTATIFPAYECAFRYEEKVLGGFQVIQANENFFEFFSYKLLLGNPKTALEGTNSLVISLSMAKSYFGADWRDKALGQVYKNNEDIFLVTGVMEDVPKQSHLLFDGVISIKHLYAYNSYHENSWLPSGVCNYVKLKPGISLNSLSQRLHQIEQTYVWPQFVSRVGISMENLQHQADNYGYYFEPVIDIHLQREGYLKYVTLFSVIAFVVLLLACVNFINLSIVKAFERAKEICIRKVLGTNRVALVWQFIAETILMTIVALLLALLSLYLLLPTFNQLTGKTLALGTLALYHWMGIVGITLLTGIASGFYPAIVISRFNPLKALKGKNQINSNKWSLKNILITIQFCIALILMISTLFIYKQYQFQKNYEVGFEKEQLLLIKQANSLEKNIYNYKEKIEQLSQIKQASISYTVPGGIYDGYRKIQVLGTDKEHTFLWLTADHNYLNVYKIPIAKGRNFSENFLADSSAIIFNEAAITELGIADDPIGQKIESWNNTTFEIIGVVADFHFESLQNQVKPLAIFLDSNPSLGQYLSIKKQGGTWQGTITQLEAMWNTFHPNAPFDYVFLDQHFDKLFIQEERLSKIVSFFTLLAVCIAALGLFGLSSYTIIQRYKEIGIRKVLGASIKDLLVLLTKNYVKYLFIAFIFAVPMTNYLVSSWLESFVYKITIAWWMFLLPAIFLSVITLLAVSSQIIKGAFIKTTETLKYE